jgi:RNA polymerase sigma factor (sigma-70 family)
MIDEVRTEHFSRRARVERAMERAFEVVSNHHVVEVDLFRDEVPAIVAGAHQAGAQLMAATYIAGVLAAQPADAEERLVDRISLGQAIARLPAHEQEVLRLVLQEGLTLDEVAEEIGVSAHTAQRRHAKALDALNDFFVERGEEDD